MNLASDLPAFSYYDDTFYYPNTIHWSDLPANSYPLAADTNNIEWKRIKEVYGNKFYSMWGSREINPEDAI